MDNEEGNERKYDRTQEVGWWRGSPEAKSLRNGLKVAPIVLGVTLVITQVLWPLDPLFMYDYMPEHSRTWTGWILCLVSGTVILSCALILFFASWYVWYNWLRYEFPLICLCVLARCGIHF